MKIAECMHDIMYDDDDDDQYLSRNYNNKKKNYIKRLRKLPLPLPLEF